MKRCQSYSSIALFRKCPKWWHHVYVLGHKAPDSPKAARGTELHLKLEEFFLGKTPYPSGDKVLRPWQRFMENLTKYSPEPEADIAVDCEWRPCAYDDPEAYAKGTVDLRYTVDQVRHILDWKSGRVYPDHPHQGEMYIALDPEDGYKSYETEFVYLDIPTHTVPRRYTKGDRNIHIVKCINIIEIINHETEYKATPSHDSCAFCPLNWRKGGSCRDAP